MTTARDKDQTQTLTTTPSPPAVRRTGLLVLLIVAAFSLPAASAMAHTTRPAGSATPDPGAQGLPVEDPSRGLTYEGLEPSREGGPCDGLFALRSDEGGLEGCTHGPDPAPEGVDVRESRSIEELVDDAPAIGASGGLTPPPGAKGVVNEPGGIAIVHDDDDVSPGKTLPPPRVPCIEEFNGEVGKRVQAIYAYASDRPGGSRYAQVEPLIQAYAAEVDQVFYESARETGGRRHVRFVTHDDYCRVKVDAVQLSPTGDNEFANTISELRAKGYKGANRKYLVWMDANPSDGFTDYCGIGDLLQDERPIQNVHNGDPSIQGTPAGMFARVDPQCWGTTGPSSGGVSPEAHELMHNLGAVQKGAPNATWAPFGKYTGGHCTDEADLMCYDDDGLQDGVVNAPCLDCLSQGQPTTQPIRQACDATHERLFDCNHEDYYNTDPLLPWHEYLTKNWNTADSSFLDDRPADREPPVVRRLMHEFLGPLGTATLPIEVTWSATDARGVRAFHLWKQTDGGAWSKVPGVTTILAGSGQAGFSWHGSTGDTLSLAPGHFYKFAVRAVDGEGDSGWTYSDQFWFYVHDETSSLINYSGSWSKLSSSDHFGGGTKRTNSAGSEASLTFHGTNIAWVGTRGPSGGHADVYLDGTKVETVSLNAPAPQNRQVLFRRHRLQWGGHTIRVLPRGDGDVDIDTFIFDNDTGS